MFTLANPIKYSTFLKTSLGVGTVLYLATNDDVQRRNKILFKTLKLLCQVSFEDKTNLIREQELQAQTLYEMLSEAGGTFVKLGQMIATNTYLFPDPYVKAMFPLLDQCPTTNFQQIKRQLEQELGQPLENVFKYIDEKPVASASIAQVHRAILHNGEEVAIKIQHKHVSRHSNNDIRMVNFGLNCLHQLFGTDYRWLSNDIHESMQKELDFKLETQNAEKIRELFKDNQNIYVPKIYHEYTTKKLIVMEFVHGYKITESDKLEKDQLSKLKISEVLNQCFAQQVFDHGFVHCDPHPGNILVRPIPQKYYTNWVMGWQAEYNEPQIILLDHGIYRDIDVETRMTFAKLWKGIILADEKSNQELASTLNVDLNDLYYPDGNRDLDQLPRIKLLKSTISFKCFEAEDPESVFDKAKNAHMSDKELLLQKQCYDYAKKLHKVVANVLCESDNRNLFFLFKNNLYIRNIDIELGYEINNIDTTLEYSLKLLEKNDDSYKGYLYYTTKYIAKSFLGMMKLFY